MIQPHPSASAEEFRLQVDACLRSDGAFTTEQIDGGAHGRHLTDLVGAGVLVRLWQGAYTTPAGATSIETRLRAADLTLGFPAAACLETAAALWGFDLSADQRLHVLAPGQAPTRRSGLVLHRDRFLAPLQTVHGRLLTHPAETAVGLAARLRGGPKSLAVLDNALRSGATARGDLADIADTLGLNHIRKVRELIQVADPAAESPGESWTRWAVLTADLPDPVLQHWVSIGSRRFRLDLAWPDLKIACEYDGVEFHTGTRLAADRERLNALKSAGWTIIHVTAQMIFTPLARQNFLAHLHTLLRTS